jgi:hypothetical protein
MPNKILTLELADGGEDHTNFKIMSACVQVVRGHEISSGRQYAKLLGIIPDLVDRYEILIPLSGGRKRRTTVESWIEVVVNSDRHIEKNPVVKRWLKSGGLKDIYKVRVADFDPNATMNDIMQELRYRLPE